MRSFLILILSVIIFNNSWAQKSGRAENENVRGRLITGTVVDEKSNPIPYASIAVRSDSDTSFLRGTATDLNGTFELRLKPGRYSLTVSFISYRNTTLPINLIEGDVQLGTIKLEPKTELLDEAVVQAEKSYMELKLDRRVYDVGKDPNNVGSNAQEILETVPSVEVDVDGTVSLRGSSNVRILIDGKPSGLTGISTQDATMGS